MEEKRKSNKQNKRTQKDTLPHVNFFEEITGDTLTKKQRDWLEEGLQQATDTEKRNQDAT
ncbi:hypothetical protein GCM10025857_52220 [Alicyclobacillus contaminans]|nr:hypothetical protein GCM10025857_52220 [Alicyclobacillus contaminans]